MPITQLLWLEENTVILKGRTTGEIVSGDSNRASWTLHFWVSHSVLRGIIKTVPAVVFECLSPLKLMQKFNWHLKLLGGEIFIQDLTGSTSFVITIKEKILFSPHIFCSLALWSPLSCHDPARRPLPDVGILILDHLLSRTVRNIFCSLKFKNQSGLRKWHWLSGFRS